MPATFVKQRHLGRTLRPFGSSSTGRSETRIRTSTRPSGTRSLSSSRSIHPAYPFRQAIISGWMARITPWSPARTPSDLSTQPGRRTARRLPSSNSPAHTTQVLQFRPTPSTRLKSAWTTTPRWRPIGTSLPSPALISSRISPRPRRCRSAALGPGWRRLTRGSTRTPGTVTRRSWSPWKPPPQTRRARRSVQRLPRPTRSTSPPPPRSRPRLRITSASLRLRSRFGIPLRISSGTSRCQRRVAASTRISTRPRMSGPTRSPSGPRTPPETGRRKPAPSSW